MKKFLTTNDLKKIEHKKGTILISSNPFNLIERNSDEIEKGSSVYTVWNFEDGFIFINTMDYDEAMKTFEKYAYNQGRKMNDKLDSACSVRDELRLEREEILKRIANGNSSEQIQAVKDLVEINEDIDILGAAIRMLVRRIKKIKAG